MNITPGDRNRGHLATKKQLQHLYSIASLLGGITVGTKALVWLNHKAGKDPYELTIDEAQDLLNKLIVELLEKESKSLE